jgi:hypothetical protein
MKNKKIEAKQVDKDIEALNNVYKAVKILPSFSRFWVLETILDLCKIKENEIN